MEAMTEMIRFIRSYRQTRRFGFPLLFTIKLAWHWRKPTPELVKTYETKVALKGESHE